MPVSQSVSQVLYLLLSIHVILCYDGLQLADCIISLVCCERSFSLEEAYIDEVLVSPLLCQQFNVVPAEVIREIRDPLAWLPAQLSPAHKLFGREVGSGGACIGDKLYKTRSWSDQ